VEQSAFLARHVAHERLREPDGVVEVFLLCELSVAFFLILNHSSDKARLVATSDKGISGVSNGFSVSTLSSHLLYALRLE
jgi:hypothetical protein